MTTEKLKAPFPWFGGKSRANELIWSRLGHVRNYVEPFAGSLAVLLGRPTRPGTETVNDLDCYLANFWRALAAAPTQVAEYADNRINEADLHARHLWLVNRADFREHMKTDPDFFDAKIAGWWVWGVSCWIGGGWCALRDGTTQRRRPQVGTKFAGIQTVTNKIPNIDARGLKGVHRKRPDIAGDKFGRGINTFYVRSQMPDVDAQCNRGVNNNDNLQVWFEQLRDRLHSVRVCCGDWSRILGDTPLGLTNNVPPGFTTGVMLDPPYDLEFRDSKIYAQDAHGISTDVRTWAIENGDKPQLRIALCGYDGEHAMPDSWECVAWKAGGGYANRGDNKNSEKERIWFSPHCLHPQRGQMEFA